MNNLAIVFEQLYDLPIAYKVKDFSKDEINRIMKEKFRIDTNNITHISSSPSESIIGVSELAPSLTTIAFYKTTLVEYSHVLLIKYIKLDVQ